MKEEHNVFFSFLLPQSLSYYLGFRDKSLFFRQVEWVRVVQVLIPEKQEARD